MRSSLSFRFLLPLVALPCAVLPAQQRRVSTSVDVPHGKVSVAYTPAPLGERSPADLPAGFVWRMSAGAAAKLTTTVPLADRSVVIAPGTYSLSARRLAQKKFELLLFRDADLYQKGIPVQVASLRLDDEETSQPNLGYTLRCSGDTLRLKLHWGKHSLNTRLHVLEVHRVATRIAGEAAELLLFKLDSARHLTRITNGETLLVGTALRKGAQSVELAIHAKRQGSNMELLFDNASLARAERMRKQRQEQEKMLAGALEREKDEARKSRIAQRLEWVRKDLTQWSALHTAAAALRETVTFKSAGIEDVRQTAAHLSVDASDKDGKLTLGIGLGRKLARFEVSEASFRK
ncbi:MAG: DUF2911 domain-containing protein [Planctomycetes bacterium]|nr:DUF2911 domain-containing protein [Planctomycetota bacterium]